MVRPAGRTLRIATCRELPEPDVDERLLQDALARRGVAARMAAWDDPAEPWDRPEPTVVRSTWNYHHAPEAFASWVDLVAHGSPLWNPAPVLHWNLHKRYLLELADRGVPVVPTRLVPRGSSLSLADVTAETGWDDVVVKPAVSCASFATMRVTPGSLPAGEGHLRALVAARDVLVQPYQPAVEGHGERAVVVIEGKATHAVRKSPRFTGEGETVSAALPVAPEEEALAMRALAPFGKLLYARVDVAHGPEGTPRVMELELLEPSLFLEQSPDALARFADALAARV